MHTQMHIYIHIILCMCVYVNIYVLCCINIHMGGADVETNKFYVP